MGTINAFPITTVDMLGIMDTQRYAPVDQFLINQDGNPRTVSGSIVEPEIRHEAPIGGLAAADAAAVAGGYVLRIVHEHHVATDLTLNAYLRFEGAGRITTTAAAPTITVKQPYEAPAHKRLFDVSLGGTVLSEGGDLAGHFYTAHWGSIAMADAWVPCQQALTSHMLSRNAGITSGKWVLPGNRDTVISAALQAFLHDGSTFTFVSVDMTSTSGKGYVGNKRTVLRTTNGDQPVIAAQAHRSSSISGFICVGATGVASTSVTAVLSGTTTLWYNPGGNTVRDSQFSAHCGIAVDCFKLGVPSDGGYPGMSEFYTQNLGTIGLTIEKMGFEGCLIGVSQGMGGLDRQGELILVRDSVFFLNKVAWVSCQDQPKSNELSNCLINFHDQIVNGQDYGVAIGRIPHVVGCNMNITRTLGTANSSRATVVFSRNFNELLGNMGHWEGTHNIDFDLNEIRLANFEDFNLPSPSVYLYSNAPTYFRGGSVLHYNGEIRDWGVFATALFFTGVTLSGTAMQFQMDLITYTDCRMIYVTDGRSIGLSYKHNGYAAVFMEQEADSFALPAAEFKDIGTGFTWSHDKWPTGFNMNATAITIAPDGVTATLDNLEASEMLRLEDLVYVAADSWSGDDPWQSSANFHHQPFARVLSIVGTVVTLHDVSGGFDVTAPAALYAYPMPLFKQRCVGTTVSGTKTITGVTPGVFDVGNRIHGDGIPDGAHVVTNNGGVGDILGISVNATASGPIELYDAILTVSGVADTAPTGVWFEGDFIRKRRPTVDVNNNTMIGWLRIGVGAAGVWTDQFVSTVSPAI